MLAILIWILFTANSFAQTKFISTKGKDIIGVDGKPFYIKGTNLGNWLVPEGYMFKFNNANSPRLIQTLINELIGPGEAKIFWKKYLNNYITHDDIHYLRSTGMNSIRIPFLFENEESQQQTINTWTRIANHYRNEPMVMGYDLLNEPIATYFDSSRYNHYLEPLYKKLTAAIRKVDPNHLLFYGGAQWDSNFRIFGKPYDPKAVYTFHKYWTATTKDVIQEYIDFSNNYKVPIYCGETGENNNEWIRQFRELLEAEHIGWHYWPYKKIDDASSILSFPRPMYYDSIIQFADTIRTTYQQIRNTRPKNEDQIKTALDGFIITCLFKNCFPNDGYIKALGLKEK